MTTPVYSQNDIAINTARLIALFRQRFILATTDKEVTTHMQELLKIVSNDPSKYMKL